MITTQAKNKSNTATPTIKLQTLTSISTVTGKSMRVLENELLLARAGF